MATPDAHASPLNRGSAFSYCGYSLSHERRNKTYRTHTPVNTRRLLTTSLRPTQNPPRYGTRIVKIGGRRREVMPP